MKAIELASQLDQLFSFYDYVHSFYGENGIYPENKRTIPQIAEATAEYLETVSYTHLTLPTSTTV